MFHYMRPHILTLVRRFLHTTWLGAAIVHCFWQALAAYSVKRYFQLPLGKHSAECPLTYNDSFTFWACLWSPHFVALILYFGTLAQMMKEFPEREAFMHLQFQGKYLLSHQREWQNSVMMGVQ